MSGSRYSVVGQSEPRGGRARVLLKLEEAGAGTPGLPKAGRRAVVAGLLWLAVLLFVGAVASWQRKRLARLGTASIEAAEEAHFQRLRSGSCASEGLHAVLDTKQCKAAAAQLGLATTPGSGVSPTNIIKRPEGCYYFINATDKTQTLWLGTSPDSIGKGTETSNEQRGWLRQPICEVPLRLRERSSSATTTAAPADPAEEGGEQDAEVLEKEEDPDPSTPAFCCFSGRDKKNVCGTCWDHAKAFLGSAAKKSKYCTKSRGSCLECGGEWCSSRGREGSGAAGAEPDAATSAATSTTATTTTPAATTTSASTAAATSTTAPSTSGAGAAEPGGRGTRAPASEKSILTLEDFKRRMGATATPKDAFMWLDKNADGIIGWNHFYSGALAFVPPLTLTEARYAFLCLDVNSDDHVTKEEFYNALNAGHFLLPSGQGGAEAAASRTGSAPQATTSTTAATTTAAAPAAGAGGAVGAEASPMSPGLEANAGAAPGVMSDGPGAEVATVDGFVGKLKSTYVSPQDAFGSFDLDGSGCIDRTEFVSAASVLAQPLSGYEASQVFNGFDVDHDDTVCTHEFFKSLRSGHFVGDHQEMKGAMTVNLFKERMGEGISPAFAFASLDKSGDGGLSLNELMEGKGAFRPQLSEEEVRSAFVGFDSDGSHLVERSEFLNAMSAGHFLAASRHALEQLTAGEFKKRLGAAEPQAAFLALDRNADGLVGFMEFVGSRGAFTPPLSDLDAQRVFAGMDANHDKHVSFDEFNTVLKTERFYRSPGKPGTPADWTPEDDLPMPALARVRAALQAPPARPHMMAGMPPVR